MNRLDYYNPPEPCYEKLIAAVNNIFDNYLSLINKLIIANKHILKITNLDTV